jgi:hypothetical protein
MNIVDVVTPIVTINTQDGTIQSQKTAQPGDAIMTRLNKDGTPKFGETGGLDQWVVDADKIKKLYNTLGAKNEYGEIVGGNNEVYFVELPKGGVVEAPWGGSQKISSGVLQYSKTTQEVYLNEGDAFKSTFQVKISPEPKNSLSNKNPPEVKKNNFNIV